MATKKYNLIFERKIKDSFELESVKENLKKFFTNNPALVEQLFLKESIILKRNITKSEADKFKTVFETTGAECVIKEAAETQTKAKMEQKTSKKEVTGRLTSAQEKNSLDIRRINELMRILRFNQKMVLFSLMTSLVSIIFSGILFFNGFSEADIKTKQNIATAELLDVEIVVLDKITKVDVNKYFKLAVKIKNKSNESFSSSSPLPVKASYHWKNTVNEKFNIPNGERTSFKTPLQAHSEVLLDMNIIAPGHPGDYILEITLVKDGAFWFEDKVKELPVKIKVKVMRKRV